MNTRLQIYFYPKKSKQNKKGFVPIACRLSLNNDRKEFYTGISVLPKHWSLKSTRVIGKNDLSNQINKQLDSIESRLRLIYSRVILKETPSSLLELYNEYTGQDLPNKLLSHVTTEHNEILKGRLQTDRNRATYDKYILTTKHIFSYLEKKHSINDIRLTSLKANHLLEFQQFLLQKGYHHNTVVKHMKNFKRYVNFSMEREWLIRNPFLSVKCGFKNSPTEILETHEIKILQDTILENNCLNNVRNLFLFQCYTGVSYIDIAKLKHSNIELRSDGLYWLTIQRIKTQVPISFPMLSPAVEILKKLQPTLKPFSNDKLFEVLSNQKMNFYLKEIAVISGISKKLVTHLGRRTHATTILLQNGVPIETISKILGHLKVSTTQIYARVGDQIVSNELKKVEDRMKKNDSNIDL